MLRNDAEKITRIFIRLLSKAYLMFHCMHGGGGGEFEFLEADVSWRKKINRYKPNVIFFSRNDNFQFPWVADPILLFLLWGANK